nr:AAA domain protein [uncultured bacterium]
MKKLVLTGGPCGGKTTGMSYLEQKLLDRGKYPLIVPEAPTLLMLGKLSPMTGAFDERTFQRAVVGTVALLEEEFERAALACRHADPILLCDRGIADAAAYMPSGLYEEILHELHLGTPVEVRDGRYDAVFHMRTAADGALSSYSTANNEVRREDAALALVRDKATEEAWIGHPHLRILDNSTDFPGKLHKLERWVCAALGIPVPLEIERKFLCRPVRWEDIPVACQDISIEQTYLQSADPDAVLRVRKRGQHGSHLYYRTEKRDVKEGVREEKEERISKEVYEACLSFRLPGTRPIRKQRWCFVWKNQYFELDSIPRRDGVLFMLELELTEENQSVELPPFLSIAKEVTDDPAYSNYALSKAA